MSTVVVVLAAGRGTRMYSDIPKVLHLLGGRPMLSHVLAAARTLNPEKVHVVTGYQSTMIHQYYAMRDELSSISWIEQAEQLGTGHAVMQAMPDIADNSTVLVLYGDVPLVNSQTLKRLVETAKATDIAVLTLVTDKPHGLGRIIRDEHGKVTAIVEDKDATHAQQQIREINTGIMAFSAAHLKTWLKALNTNNAQGEYYLTDTVAIANASGKTVGSLCSEVEAEVQGVNNRLQLAELERSYQLAQAKKLLIQGVTLRDPSRFDQRGDLSTGRDVSIDVNVILEGDVKLGDRVKIGPNVTIINSEIGDDCEILANSHVEGSILASDCTVGPFARLRPGTELKAGAKIGNFVETKKSVIGQASKVNHLSYIGDSTIGDSVNIGAGTITCNYDGVNKHKTNIKDGVFVGSNTALVAPINIGKNVTIAAGSVITADVPDGDLSVARGKQRNIPGWKRPVKK